MIVPQPVAAVRLNELLGVTAIDVMQKLRARSKDPAHLASTYREAESRLVGRRLYRAHTVEYTEDAK